MDKIIIAMGGALCSVDSWVGIEMLDSRYNINF